MQYPSRSEYCTSIRNPQFAFRKKDSLTKVEYNLDATLVNGKVVEKIKPDGTKDIWSASGSFAIVFKFETFFPSKTWAVRCFYRSNFEINNHYKIALTRIKNSSCRSYFVDFSFLEEGIRVQGNCYPILKMEWIEGENLKKFIKANLDNSNILKELAQLWVKLAKELLSSGIAHGDLQHGNILVVKHYHQLSIKLIDYDSLYFVEDSSSIDDNIKGLSDYQHPLRKELKKRCLEVDFFPQIVIYISILALAENKKLWETYRIDEKEGLLFSSSDFQDPDRASIFKALAKLPHPLPELATNLKEICQLKDFSDIPSLSNVLFNEQEYIPHRTEMNLSRQASSFSPLINFIQSGASSVDLLRRSILAQTERLQFISSSKFKQYFEGKVEGTKQIGVFLVETQKDLTDKFNNVKCTASKKLTTITETKISVKQKINILLNWVEQVRGDLSHTYSLTSKDISMRFYAFKEKNVVVVLDAVNQLENISQFLSSFSNYIASLSKRAETTWNIEAQLADNHSLPFTQPQVDQSNLPAESEDGEKSKEIELKTWTTAEVALQLGCSVNWCNRQRYQYPEKFHQSTHYLKDKAGMIQWTEAGAQQLRCLMMQKQLSNIPSNSLTNKEASAKLGISTQLLSKIKAKHVFKFIEGTHYYIDSRKRYYWTPVGIELLRQLQGAYLSESLHPKTQPSQKSKF